MNTVRWNLAVSPDVDQSVRMYIASQGRARKGALSSFIEEAVSAYLFQQTAKQAKETFAASGLNAEELDDVIHEAVAWARHSNS